MSRAEQFFVFSIFITFMLRLAPAGKPRKTKENKGKPRKAEEDQGKSKEHQGKPMKPKEHARTNIRKRENNKRKTLDFHTGV